MFNYDLYSNMSQFLIYKKKKHILEAFKKKDKLLVNEVNKMFDPYGPFIHYVLITCRGEGGSENANF